MFKVEDKETGKIFTVYALNGTHFLTYDKELDWWFFKDINECRPVDDLKGLMICNIAEGGKNDVCG